MAGRKPHILYLVHDVHDPTVARRTSMFLKGGATVRIMGFRRSAEPLDHVEGCGIIDLGRTRNGQFLHRLASVAGCVLILRRHRSAFAGVDVIVARNLEMLAIGVRGRALCKPCPVLVYECLDIHRLLLGHGMVGTGLRALEGWLSRRASALITSSPAFVTEYFDKRSLVRLPVRLVENKVPEGPGIPGDLPPRVPGPPWRIGWFGAIRCRDSLRILEQLVRCGGGRIEVVIRGRPAHDQMPDFDEVTSRTPGLKFLGPYKNPGDLRAIYRDVHFTWAIDRFETKLNSLWLLPNRLYEGCLFASVPLAEKSVETGRFLDARRIGVTLPDDLAMALETFFNTLTPDFYNTLEGNLLKLPKEVWICDLKSCIDVVEYIGCLNEAGMS